MTFLIVYSRAKEIAAEIVFLASPGMCHIALKHAIFPCLYCCRFCEKIAGEGPLSLYNPAQPQNGNDSNSNNGETNATHAMDTTHPGDKQRPNEASLESKNNSCIQENIIKNSNSLKSYNRSLDQNTATSIDCKNKNNTINTVGSVAEIKNVSYSPAITTNTITPIIISSQQAEKVKNEAGRLGLPDIPCAFCNYQHYIEFDLGNHLLEKHKLELLKLPIGEGYSIEYRIKCVIEQAKKKKIAEGLAADEEEEGEEKDEYNDEFN